MKIGNLDFRLVPDRTGLRLRILGRPYGQETIVTADEVRALAAYFHHTADKEERHDRDRGKDHDLR